MANRLKEKYLNEVVPALTEKFNYSSVMAVPKVDKIVLNMGVGDAVSNAKNLEKAAEELALISGQKPLITKAKKSIAGFRLREGVAIGAKVTLRGERMYEFLDKLVTVSLPRVRDFHGVPTKSFDGRGNYTLVANTSCNTIFVQHLNIRHMDWCFFFYDSTLRVFVIRFLVFLDDIYTFNNNFIYFWKCGNDFGFNTFVFTSNHANFVASFYKHWFLL